MIFAAFALPGRRNIDSHPYNVPQYRGVGRFNIN